jgi:hypothetical protein
MHAAFLRVEERAGGQLLEHGSRGAHQRGTPLVLAKERPFHHASENVLGRDAEAPVLRIDVAEQPPHGRVDRLCVDGAGLGLLELDALLVDLRHAVKDALRLIEVLAALGEIEHHVLTLADPRLIGSATFCGLTWLSIGEPSGRRSEIAGQFPVPYLGVDVGAAVGADEERNVILVQRAQHERVGERLRRHTLSGAAPGNGDEQEDRLVGDHRALQRERCPGEPVGALRQFLRRPRFESRLRG